MNNSSKKTEETKSTLQSNIKATGTKTNMLRKNGQPLGPNGNTNTNTNGQTPEPTPVPIPTPGPTPVPIPTPGPTPVPIPTPGPTPVPIPIPGPTPGPNPTPTPNPNPNADGKIDGNGITSSLRTASYADLVVNVQRPMCPDSEDPRLGKKKLEDIPSEDYYPAQGPKRKPNPYKIMDTEEFLHINYLFDYLDEFLIKSQGKTFLQIMVNEFKSIYQQALAMPKTDSQIADPYTPEKLLFYYSNGAAGTEPFTDPRLTSPKAEDVKIINPTSATDEATIFKTIASFNKNFNPEIYKKGITPLQILKILL
ncbi:MAG: hypothetical protein FJX95_11015, partial [Bacteroidetes bacterium]|nr:hypothetical protein [Bacteroidota bacterium]